VNIQELVSGVLAGDRRVLAKAITLLESDAESARNLLKMLPRRDAHALVVGVTGSTGSGKSTLIGRLSVEFAKQGLGIGILAIDPTSPFTGGAVLGDRLRMIDVSVSDKIFIRSMASRGGLGGLSEAAEGAAKLLEASGKDVIIIETVGAGQSDIEVSRIADVVLLVMMPQAGDEIQGLKAGILEIADIIVINKADLPGAEATLNILRNTLGKHVRIVKTSALSGEGVADLAKILLEQRSPASDVRQRRRKRVEEALIQSIIKKILPSVMPVMMEDETFKAVVEKILDRQLTVEEASRELSARVSLTISKAE